MSVARVAGSVGGVGPTRAGGLLPESCPASRYPAAAALPRVLLKATDSRPNHCPTIQAFQEMTK